MDGINILRPTLSLAGMSSQTLLFHCTTD